MDPNSNRPSFTRYMLFVRNQIGAYIDGTKASHVFVHWWGGPKPWIARSSPTDRELAHQQSYLERLRVPLNNTTPCTLQLRAQRRQIESDPRFGRPFVSTYGFMAFPLL